MDKNAMMTNQQRYNFDNLDKRLEALSDRLFAVESILALNPVAARQPHCDRHNIPGASGILYQEQGYEILAFRATEKHPDKPGCILSKEETPATFEAFLHTKDSPYWEIYQVRRRSDDTVWTLDALASINDKRGNIVQFEIQEGRMMVRFVAFWYELSLLEAAGATPDWEIVEFKDTKTGSVYYLKEDGRYAQSELHATGMFTLEDMLHDERCVGSGSFSIHAVRRKDGEVFKVGDTIRNKDSNPGVHGTIDKLSLGLFEWSKNIMYACFQDSDGNTNKKELVNIEHYAPPQTLTTADLVEVKEGDTVWFRSGSRVTECKAFKGLNWTNHYSTKEAAERGPVPADPYREAVEEVYKEAQRAKSLFKDDFVNQHEGYAVILEELDELWQEVKKNQKNYDIEAQRKEAIQCAAMCIRFIAELTNK